MGVLTLVWLALTSAPLGEIVRLQPGTALVDAGVVDGLQRGDVVEIDREVEVDLPDHGVRAFRPLGRAVLLAVGADRSLLRLPPGARLGDRAQVVRRHLRSRDAFPAAAAPRPSPSRAPAVPPG